MPENSAVAPLAASPFRPDCLNGKVALITGGGSGIGFEIARQLLLHGCHAVILCGRRASFLARASASLAHEVNHQSRLTTKQVATYQVCDVRDPQSCQAVVQHCQKDFGRLDVLVNGAAGNFLARANELSPKGFATVMNIDALGTFNMSHAAYPLLKETAANQANNGADALVINVSATLQLPATFWQSHASAAKAAVDSLTRSLALEWGPSRIRVMGIAPGPIANTPGTTKLAPNMEEASEEMAEMVTEGIPLQRMGEAFEIAFAAVFLCTAKYCTGDVLIVDGGQWLYKPPIVPGEMVSYLSREVEQKSRAVAPPSATTRTNNTSSQILQSRL